MEAQDDEALARELHRELNVGPRRRQRRPPPPPRKREAQGKSMLRGLRRFAGVCVHICLIVTARWVRERPSVLQERGLTPSPRRMGQRQKIAMISPLGCRRKVRLACRSNGQQSPLREVCARPSQQSSNDHCHHRQPWRGVPLPQNLYSRGMNLHLQV